MDEYNLFRSFQEEIQKEIEEEYSKMSPEEVKYRKIQGFLLQKQFDHFIKTGVNLPIEDFLHEQGQNE